MDVTTFFSAEMLETLALIALLTCFTVQGIKKACKNTKLYNCMAIGSSVVWTAIVAVFMIIRQAIPVTPDIILYWIITAILAAIISMIGYDKFTQSIAQFVANKKMPSDDEE